ncbi:MAG TPA: helix-turn-helix transcriptional regulator, partial [Lacipirellulaceae bacterium]|nr:helix-turn-helix transcriptional regulator [Lacipirellulaceae bacterium]
MERKLIRSIRSRPLSPEEAARDREARSAVVGEFPPRLTASSRQPAPLSEMLKQAIRDSGRPLETVANDAGLSPTLVAGFMAGQRDIHMATADKLAQALGL